MTPEVDVAAAKTTTTTGQRKDAPDAGSFPAPGAPDAAEQVSLKPAVGGSSKRHASTTLHKRNKELVYSEVFTTVLYIVLLYIFSLTAGSTIYDARTGVSNKTDRVWSGHAVLGHCSSQAQTKTTRVLVMAMTAISRLVISTEDALQISPDFWSECQ